MINFLLMFCHVIVQCTINKCCNQISGPKKCSIRGPLWVRCLVTVWSIEFAVSGGQRGYWFCKSNTERWGCAYLWLTSAICVRNGYKVYPVLSLPRSGTNTDWHWLATNYPASFLPWALLAQISIQNYTAQIDKMCFLNEILSHLVALCHFAPQIIQLLIILINKRYDNILSLWSQSEIFVCYLVDPQRWSNRW